MECPNLGRKKAPTLSPPLWIKKADDNAGLYFRPLVERFLDLTGKDILTSRDDQLLDSINDNKVFLLVQDPYIARSQPTIPQNETAVSWGLSRYPFITFGPSKDQE